MQQWVQGISAGFFSIRMGSLTSTNVGRYGAKSGCTARNQATDNGWGMATAAGTAAAT